MRGNKVGAHSHVRLSLEIESLLPVHDIFGSHARRVSPFLAWGHFHARSRFARSTIPEEKWGTTRSLP